MPYRDAWALLTALWPDTGTQCGAVFHGYEYPVSFSDLLSMQLIDMVGSAMSDSWKPLPRPWAAPVSLGKTTVSRETAIEHFRALGHGV